MNTFKNNPNARLVWRCLSYYFLLPLILSFYHQLRKYIEMRCRSEKWKSGLWDVDTRSDAGIAPANQEGSEYEHASYVCPCYRRRARQSDFPKFLLPALIRTPKVASHSWLLPGLVKILGQKTLMKHQNLRFQKNWWDCACSQKQEMFHLVGKSYLAPDN